MNGRYLLDVVRRLLWFNLGGAVVFYSDVNSRGFVF